MPTPDKKLQRLNIVALVLVAVTVIAGYALVTNCLSLEQSNGRRINLAGRQRMISVVIAKSVDELTNPTMAMEDIFRQQRDLENWIDKFQQMHRALKLGDPSLGLPPCRSHAEGELWSAVDAPHKSLVALAIEMATSETPHKEKELADGINAVQATFLQAMDHLVFHMDAEAASQVARTQQAQTALLIATLLVLLFEAVFIFRPATAEIRRAIVQLHESERTLRESENRHRDLIRYSAGPILCLEPSSGRITDINLAGASDLGESAQTIVGKPLQSFLSGPSAEILADQLEQIATEEFSQCNLSIRCDIENSPAGGRLWLSRFTMYRSGTGRPIVMLSAHDITDQAMREKQLIEASQRDGLTGLYNRREFDRRLTELDQQYETEGIPYTLAMIDIDDFKNINDEFGHKAGDSVLKQLAQVIELSCRAADIVSRYGGDEFAVLFPSVKSVHAAKLLERVRDSLTNASIVAPGTGNVLRTIPVTLSIGVAAVPTHALDADQLVQMADDALYRVKHSGRNDIAFARTGSKPSPAVASAITWDDATSPVG